MENQSTKQRILQAALTLFAQNGYEAVRVAQIAEAVGIKAPSLYKHYTSKQSIFDAILAEMEARYKAQVGAMHLDGQDPAKDAEALANTDEAHLVAVARGLFLYYLHDEFASPFRRMLAVEQSHNSSLAALYAKQYIEDPLTFQGSLFGLLVSTGRMRPEDTGIMALHFYAPVFLLLTLCDCKPEMESEALTLIEKNITQFERLYRAEPANHKEESPYETHTD